MRNYILTLFGLLLLNSTGYCDEQRKPSSSIAERREEILKRFPESDSNGDGVLSTSELAEHIKKQRSSPDANQRFEQLLTKFPEADTDKDGVLSGQEWRKYLAANRDKIQERSRRSRAPKIVAPVPDVAYGDHPLQRFDLWPVPEAKSPTPLVIFIHGGGFRGGDKSLVRAETIETYRKAGIAFASMNYRLSDSGPYPIMMHDAARGLQTLRHRAQEWNIDPERVVCYGGSAGAGISLWLAFHDDMADPSSQDPIARQSTRILAAGTMNGQSTYDMHTFREWFEIPDLVMGPALPAFLGIEGEEDLNKPEVKAVMKDASPITHLSEDDKIDVYMLYSRPNDKVTKESSHSIWVHHVLLGLKLQEAMQSYGRECIVTAPDISNSSSRYDSLEDFLIEKVKAESSGK